MENRKAIIVGISGCSSSGKTTLARLLRDIFPNTFILHEDDFYKPEDQLPIRNGLVDWDCPEAISVPDMEQALAHIRSAGTFPPTITSKEDQNSVGATPIPESKLPRLVDSLKSRVADWLRPSQPGYRIFKTTATTTATTKPKPESTTGSALGESSGETGETGESRGEPESEGNEKEKEQGIRLCLLDGFLLYSPTTPEFKPILSSLDIKLFLLVSREKATRRREARDGYVTLEGFWKDPPGYVDRIVWPNYAAAHAWLFENADAEAGVIDREAMERENIKVQLGRGLDVDFAETLEWAVDTIMAELEAIVLGRG